MKRVIITGGCGFVGHHIVEHFLKKTDWEIDIFDKLTYASSGLDRVRDINAFDSKRVNFYAVDLTRPPSVGILQECRNADYILHLAAETHVDRSITDPMSFVYSNVVGTGNLLQFARECENLKAFVMFSTDEVFGPAVFEEPNFWSTYNLNLKTTYREWDRYNCTNPYSASKAGAEQLTLAFMNTYKIPGFVVHCMNIFGERQHPEKFIPLCINKTLKGEAITIHSDPTGKKSGSRFYIHARNVANAVHFLLDKFTQREIYNIVGEVEVTNLELAQKIANTLTKPLYYDMVDFHSQRPGHDLRYSLDGSKMRSMGWEVPVTFDKSLKKTINWTLENRKWLQKNP